MAFFQFPPSEEHEDDLGPPPRPFRFRRRWRFAGGLRWAGLLVGLLVLFIIANIAKGLYADWLWFDSVDYVSVFRTRLVTRVWLFFAGSGVFLAFFGANVLAALRTPSGPHVGAGFAAEFEPAALRRILLVLGIAATLFLAVIFGALAAGQWDSVLLFLHSERFGVEEPLFGQDVGFYVFRLPLLRFIQGWSLAAVILATIAVAAVHIARMVLHGFSREASPGARIHVSLLVVAILGLFVWRYWLGRYALVYSDRGAAFGAGYTDIHAQLPVIYALMGFAALAATLVLLSLALRRGLWLPVGAILLWVVAGIVGGMIYPATVQRFSVEPNELAKERSYIERNIELTRRAYGLDRIDERPFPARAEVTEQELAQNPETIQNIRLWDHRPLLQTLNQVQTIRQLYDFLNVDVDRYVLNGQLRQVMLAARELNPDKLPVDARTWVNRRLQFTHGYGLAVVPVNEVVQEGLPEFFVKDIPPAGVIDVEEPRLYYSEMPDHYVVVNSNEDEFDYQSSEETVKTVFQGDGGVRLGSFLRRLVYAWEFTDANLLISDALNDDSRLLYRRNVQQRIREIAPFLRLDPDPYLVVADGRLFWVQDAYTTTDAYPYSTRSAGGFNYVRNSVKAVVDAYDGSVTFYLVEPDEPLARAYDRIYPDLFRPLDEMPASLRAHLRYPEELFRVQADLYRAYHIRDAGAFYNKEDLWDIPTEVFLDRQQLLEPYYVIMRLPGEPEEEFALILPFRPSNRNNTIAWLAARSDGAQYGKLLTFRFPTQSLIFGPGQIESRIDQDTAISQQFSLWNQSGSQVLRGNLLMIPIGEGNLFVEPIYLQATASQLPELKRVVVVNGNSIAMEPTLAQSLAVILGRAQATLPTTEAEPSPTPGATPAGGPTPRASPSPQPTPPLPEDVAALIAEADAVFRRAQDLLRQGDFAGYGREVDRLEEILNRLSELTGATPTPAP